MIGLASAPVRVLQVTDPHLFADPTRRIYGVVTAESFRRVLAQALRPGVPRPHAIVVTGDVADDHTTGAYENFRSALEPYGLPVFCLPGNHDAPTSMRDLGDRAGFQFGGTATLGAWGMVFVDTHLPGRPEGGIAPAELARLERELRSFGTRPTAVCLHHPPLPVGSAWLDAVGLLDPTELLALIERSPNVKVVLAGHVHQEFEGRHGPAVVLTTPSTCAQFTPRTERCVMDLKPPGYRWLELHADGSVRTSVEWLEDWVVGDRPPDDRFGS